MRATGLDHTDMLFETVTDSGFAYSSTALFQTRERSRSRRFCLGAVYVSGVVGKKFRQQEEMKNRCKVFSRRLLTFTRLVFKKCDRREKKNKNKKNKRQAGGARRVRDASRDDDISDVRGQSVSELQIGRYIVIHQNVASLLV